MGQNVVTQITILSQDTTGNGMIFRIGLWAIWAQMLLLSARKGYVVHTAVIHRFSHFALLGKWVYVQDTAFWHQRATSRNRI